MAQALQCPTCGSTTRLDDAPSGETIQCQSCGHAMKVPPSLPRRSGRAPGAPATPETSAPATSAPGGGAAPAVAPPAPRRLSRPTMTAGGASAAAAGGGTAVIAPDSAPPPALAKEGGGRSRRGRVAGSSTGRDALPLWMRIAVWVIALPLGLLVVGLPARQLGYLTSQKLLDVIVKRDLGRFVPIVVIVALWALVTAVLVTVLIEGGRRWMLHRQGRAPRSGA